jgi:hypothetical protein
MAAPDITWVLPELGVGGRPDPAHLPRLVRELRVRRVVDLRQEERDDEQALGRLGGRLLHLPTPDTCAVAQEHLDLGVRWVVEGLERRERVLVHCQHGIGRSALLACCVLVSLGNSPSQALQLAKDSRPCISPSPVQLEALLTWSRSFRAARGAPAFPDTLHDLMCIAYRHLQG